MTPRAIILTMSGKRESQWSSVFEAVMSLLDAGTKCHND